MTDVLSNKNMGEGNMNEGNEGESRGAEIEEMKGEGRRNDKDAIMGVQDDEKTFKTEIDVEAQGWYDAQLKSSDDNSLLSMVQADEISLADALYAALTRWTGGRMPPSVVEFVGMSRADDVCDAVIRGQNLEWQGVVHAGAGDGWPATQLALQRGAKWIISVEPNERRFRKLLNLHAENVSYVPVLGAVGAKPGWQDMMFHADLPNFSCFDCFNVRKDPRVTVHPVPVYTVDGLILNNDVQNALPSVSPSRTPPPSSKPIPPGPTSVQGATASSQKPAVTYNISFARNDSVNLLRSSTYKYDGWVMEGSSRLLRKGMIDHVMFNFNLQTFRTKQNALRVVTLVLDAGLQCAHLALNMTAEDRASNSPTLYMFHEPITHESLPAFYNFIRRIDHPTELLCIKR